MESGHAVTAIAPVLAAGVGVRYDSRWVLRTVSFRLDQSDLGGASLGIVTERSPAASTLIGLLTGKIAPDYGSLRVLGYDMNIRAARAAVRRQTGTASRASHPVGSTRIRALVERAARHTVLPGSDRRLLVAAILDRMALTPWADAELAAACVHQPKLLLLDSLLDHLQPLDRTVLADVIRDLRRDTAVMAIGSDADSLELVCDQVIPLRGGILVGAPRPVIRQDATQVGEHLVDVGDRHH